VHDHSTKVLVNIGNIWVNAMAALIHTFLRSKHQPNEQYGLVSKAYHSEVCRLIADAAQHTPLAAPGSHQGQLQAAAQQHPHTTQEQSQTAATTTAHSWQWYESSSQFVTPMAQQTNGLYAAEDQVVRSNPEDDIDLILDSVTPHASTFVAPAGSQGQPRADPVRLTPSF
jgi:hypothetical protein